MKIRKLLALGAACASLFGLGVSLNAQTITINGEVASFSDNIPANSTVTVKTPSMVTLTVCGDSELEVTGNVVFTVDRDCGITFVTSSTSARIELDGVAVNISAGSTVSVSSGGDVNISTGSASVSNNSGSNVNVTSNGETSQVATGTNASFASGGQAAGGGAQGGGTGGGPSTGSNTGGGFGGGDNNNDPLSPA